MPCAYITPRLSRVPEAFVERYGAGFTAEERLLALAEKTVGLDLGTRKVQGRRRQ